MSASTPTRARATIAKGAAAIAVVAALAFGASAITKSGSSAASGPGAQTGQAAPAQAGNGTRPQMGTAVTGTTLTKLKQVVAAKYPGTVERAIKLPDGSYEVHVIRSSGEIHVLVSRDFAITGTQQGGPPGGAPPSGAAEPGGTTS